MGAKVVQLGHVRLEGWETGITEHARCSYSLA